MFILSCWFWYTTWLPLFFLAALVKRASKSLDTVSQFTYILPYVSHPFCCRMNDIELQTERVIYYCRCYEEEYLASREVS